MSPRCYIPSLGRGATTLLGGKKTLKSRKLDVNKFCWHYEMRDGLIPPPPPRSPARPQLVSRRYACPSCPVQFHGTKGVQPIPGQRIGPDIKRVHVLAKGGLLNKSSLK